MEALTLILMALSLLFFTGGSVGILRFPDFYSRLHAAGKLDTLGSLLMLAALALYHLKPLTFISLLTSLKILLVFAFIFMASPTATHAIVDAGVRAGLTPWRK